MKIGDKVKIIKLKGNCQSLYKYKGQECEISDIFETTFKVTFTDGRSFHVFPDEIVEI